ncbi:MAG TPA: hypothetical protein VLE43_19895 [Candidatus Saccharimonadia bacterium]|nr:hypothetical protein [Candidatus Saccharimonadia bacterium]
MIAEALEARLKQWNTVCTLGENPAYRAWLEKSYPHWKHAADFTRLTVKVINEEHSNMLCRDGWDYIAWFQPEAVKNTTVEFASAGLLMIGASAGGDVMVIDTRAESDLAIGFVSHEALWEDNADPRKAFRPWRHDLLTFLDKMAESERYVP